MKARLDFVSNSSSSSFIVISDRGSFMKKFENIYSEITVPNESGEMYFGWQTEKYYDFWSKINWCAIIIHSLADQEKYEKSSEKLEIEIKKPWFKSSQMKKMLKKVCKERLGIDISVVMPIDEDGYPRASIDHQSNVGESPENARMFTDEKMLYDFLANDHSYVDNSNDNGGRDDDDYDLNTWRPMSIPNDYEV